MASFSKKVDEMQKKMLNGKPNQNVNANYNLNGWIKDKDGNQRKQLEDKGNQGNQGDRECTECQTKHFDWNRTLCRNSKCQAPLPFKIGNTTPRTAKKDDKNLEVMYKHNPEARPATTTTTAPQQQPQQPTAAADSAAAAPAPANPLTQEGPGTAAAADDNPPTAPKVKEDKATLRKRLANLEKLGSDDSIITDGIAGIKAALANIAAEEATARNNAKAPNLHKDLATIAAEMSKAVDNHLKESNRLQKAKDKLTSEQLQVAQQLAATEEALLDLDQKHKATIRNWEVAKANCEKEAAHKGEGQTQNLPTPVPNPRLAMLQCLPERRPELVACLQEKFAPDMAEIFTGLIDLVSLQIVNDRRANDDQGQADAQPHNHQGDASGQEEGGGAMDDGGDDEASTKANDDDMAGGKRDAPPAEAGQPSTKARRPQAAGPVASASSS